MKKALPWILAFAAVLLLGYLADRVYREWRGVRGELAALRATDEKAQAVIAEKDAEIRTLVAANVELRAKDAAGETEKAAIRKERDTARAKLAQAIEDLKTAPPETVLVQTQGWLDTREIWLRANAASQVEAVFSLFAFRTNGQALAEHQHLKFTLVPSLEREIETQSGQLTAVRSERDNLVVIVADKDIIIGEKGGQITARDEAIRALKKSNLWRELRDFGAGFVVKTILDFIFGK